MVNDGIQEPASASTVAPSEIASAPAAMSSPASSETTSDLARAPAAASRIFDGVQAGPADRAALDQGDRQSACACLGGCGLGGRAASEDDEIEVGPVVHFQV